MFLLPTVPAICHWMVTISSAVPLLWLWFQPAQSSPYEDLGIICIALVFLYLLFQAAKQGRRLYLTLKNRAEV